MPASGACVGSRLYKYSMRISFQSYMNNGFPYSDKNLYMTRDYFYKYWLTGIVVTVAIATLSGCSSNPTLTVAQEGWAYENKAIYISVRATADLNEVSERPHALALSVFQLSDTNTFTGLSTTRDGAIELLDKGKIDSTVAQYTRIIIQPGEKKLISLDRAQTAKYVGIIAGYNQLDPSLDVHLFQIPVVPSKRGLVDKALAASTLIADEAKGLPGKLYLNIELDGQTTRRMVDVTSQVSDK